MNGTNGNEPGYPENALVPYPVIVAATKGDPDAMKGNPAYNVVVLYDENGNVVGGVNADGSTVASQIIMAPEPGDAMLGDVSEGSWVYWIEPGDLASMKLPKQVRAELYRVDNALTNEGQRLVSDSLPGDVPDNLPDVELGGNATVAAD